MTMSFPGSNNNSHAICDLLATLPPQTPVNAVVTDGGVIPATSFITLDKENNRAFFLNGTNISVYDCREINMVQFPAP